MLSVKRRGVIQLCHWSVLNDGLVITESLTIPPSLLRLFYIVYAMTHNVRLILAGTRSDTKLRVPGTTKVWAQKKNN